MSLVNSSKFPGLTTYEKGCSSTDRTEEIDKWERFYFDGTEVAKGLIYSSFSYFAC